MSNTKKILFYIDKRINKLEEDLEENRDIIDELENIRNFVEIYG